MVSRLTMDQQAKTKTGGSARGTILRRLLPGHGDSAPRSRSPVETPWAIQCGESAQVSTGSLHTGCQRRIKSCSSVQRAA